MYSYNEIIQVHLEPTQKCQARCPMCDRNKNGGETNQYLSNADLSLNDIKKMFPIPFVKQLNNLYMCGNHGDPIFAPECLEIMKWLRAINPNIFLSITTNGGARDPEWWEELAGVVNQVIFSVDGLEDTNHLYRQGVNWASVEENMEAFCDAGGIAQWVFLVFNYNEHQVEEARAWSKMIGVKEFVIKKSGRYISTHKLKTKGDKQAIDRKGNDTTLLSPPKARKYQNKATKDYDEIEVKFGNLENYLQKATIDCKAIPKKEIYVTAEGFVHPCCWTAGRMYKWWRGPGEGQIWEHINKFETSALKTTIEDIVDNGFFKSIEDSWSKDGFDNGKLKVCALKCNKKYDPFSAQWQ